MTSNKIGIWMDHDHAYLIAFDDATKQAEIIPSKFNHETKYNNISGGEYHGLAREQRHRNEYYSQLADVILSYDEVVIFGPTTAKTELIHKLAADQRFSKINVRTASGDKMTEAQMRQFVRDYFSVN